MNPIYKVAIAGVLVGAFFLFLAAGIQNQRALSTCLTEHTFDVCATELR